ncbi:MAG: hypothetical protein HYV97_15500 [Bdellovibrio sp.]|nr:hypothetical protein [Bdellovibrio sp.]
MSIKLVLSAIVLSLLCMTVACQKSTLSVVTTPEQVTVSIVDPESGLSKEIGQTPLTIDEKTELPASIRDSRIWGITLSKRGHVVEHVLLDRAANSKFKITSNLKKSSEWVGEDNQIVGEMANRIGRSLRDTYHHINARDYTAAMKTIEVLIQNFPSTAIFFDIKGSIHMLRGEREAAISSYKSSLQLNPDSPETRAALTRLLGTSNF